MGPPKMGDYVKLTPDKQDEVKRLRLEGKTYDFIAVELGLGRSCVTTFCRRNGLSQVALRPGTNTHKYREKIKKMFLEGKTYREISAELGISQGIVSGVLTRSPMRRGNRGILASLSPGKGQACLRCRQQNPRGVFICAGCKGSEDWKNGFHSYESIYI